VDPGEERRRLRAARAYADFSLDELAERVEMGRSTLIRVDQGERNLKRMEISAIAEACGLPVEFFTADFNRLGELPPSLEEWLAAIAAAVGATPDVVAAPGNHDLGPPAGPLRRELEADRPSDKGPAPPNQSGAGSRRSA
jgi:transcriptional regulator with XRE-family HTH domain